MRIKTVILATYAIFAGTVLYGQNNTSSPYSRYGLGMLEDMSFGRNQGLGGSGIALRSNKTINPANPAAFSAIDTLSQIFEFGLTGNISRFSNSTESQITNDINFNYLGFAIPISKNIGFSMGVLPFTSIGYEYDITANPDNIGEVNYSYYGTGGISQAFIGLSYKPVKYLSVGFNLDYLFGSTVYNQNVTFTDNTTFSDFYRYEKVTVNALHPIFGLQYIQPLNAKHSIVLGAVYEPKTSLNAKQDLVTSKQLSGIQPVTIENLQNKKIGIDMPETMGFGIAYEKSNTFTVTADLRQQRWSQAEFYNKTDTLNNRTRLSAGIEYIPNYIDRNYFKRVEYRIGASYSSGYLKGLGGNLHNFGMTFGLGLPLRFTKTRFNIALELGQMKSDNNSLISESYGRLTINFSLNDFWFVRRKFE